jgi:branched-chain amino acid transport system substrate-binding protein
MAKGNKETVVLIITLLVSVGLVGGGFVWLRQNLGRNQVVSRTSTNPNHNSDQHGHKPTTHIGTRISSGEWVLFADSTNAQKKAATFAITMHNYTDAIARLESSLEQVRNDPETLVYLNNARAKQSGNSLKIAASLPISSNPDPAKEILRGIAQAQNQINQAGGINGALLEVAIADDANQASLATEIAIALVQDAEVLAVVGSFGSNVTIAAAEIYQSQWLVQISPTSTATALSTMGDYIFRTVPSDRLAADALVDYAINTLQVRKVAVFYNSQSNYSRSLRNEFATALVSDGGELVWEVDLAAANFDPLRAIDQVRKNQAEAVLLAANSETLRSAFEVMAVNRQNLPLLGGDSFYRRDTLVFGGENGVGMVLAVPWHILANPASDFPTAAAKLWGGDVNWRTAMAYDATQAIVAALTKSPTREGVKQALRADDFAAQGADGQISFQPSGDRNRRAILVQVVKAPADNPNGRSGTGYDFTPIELSD